jgi:hypothetical protein
VALDGSRLGNAIVDALKAGGFYPSSHSPAQEARSRAEWSVIASTIVSEIINHQDIVLQAADIQVLPGTFMDSRGGNVTGIGVSEPTTLSTRIA